MNFGVVRSSPTRKICKMASDTKIVGSGLTFCFGEQRIRPASHAGDYFCEPSVGSGLEAARSFVPPTAVHTPDIPHNEFWFIVERTQIGQCQRVGRERHRMDDLIEGGAIVHEVNNCRNKIFKC